MDIIDIKLIEKYTLLPMDIIRYLSDFIYIKLTDDNIKDAVTLWFKDKEQCKLMYGHISYWKTGKVTNMSCLFRKYKNFNEDISRWNVSNVKNMNSMFEGATSFNSDISNWDVKRVQGMRFMFYNATSFNSNISNWNVSTVTSMHFMFCCANSFNSDISNWDISNVQDMRFMFSGATSFNCDLSSWNVGNIIENENVFYFLLLDYDPTKKNVYNMFKDSGVINTPHWYK